ncbi:MAG: hypothetical protein ABSE49_05265 [Polyangiaceae bacterium]
MKAARLPTTSRISVCTSSGSPIGASMLRASARSVACVSGRSMSNQ